MHICSTALPFATSDYGVLCSVVQFQIGRRTDTSGKGDNYSTQQPPPENCPQKRKETLEGEGRTDLLRARPRRRRSFPHGTAQPCGASQMAGGLGTAALLDILSLPPSEPPSEHEQTTTPGLAVSARPTSGRGIPPGKGGGPAEPDCAGRLGGAKGRGRGLPRERPARSPTAAPAAVASSAVAAAGEWGAAGAAGCQGHGLTE